MVSSVLKAEGNNHRGTCFCIITSWFSAPPYIATLAKALEKEGDFFYQILEQRKYILSIKPNHTKTLCDDLHGFT